MGNCMGMKESKLKYQSSQHIDKTFSIDATSLDEVSCPSPTKIGHEKDHDNMLDLVFETFDKNKSNFLEID